MFDYLPRSLEYDVIMVNRYETGKIKYDGQIAWRIKNDNNNMAIHTNISRVTVASITPLWLSDLLR